MFFPTLVLGTLNSVMSPIVTGTHRILETQTFDMNEYRRQKDKLEFEAMKRNPETAYLVDKESLTTNSMSWERWMRLRLAECMWIVRCTI